MAGAAHRIVEAGVDRLDALRALAEELMATQLAIAPHVPPVAYRSPDWDGYRRFAVAALARPGSLLLVAEDGDGAPLGYALVVERAAHPGDVPAVEVDSLVVDAAARGRGIGTALLEAVDAEVARRGPRHPVIGVIVGNEGAERLYRSRGFVPAAQILVRRADAVSG